jgi:hypothetical protein
MHLGYIIALVLVNQYYTSTTEFLIMIAYPTIANDNSLVIIQVIDTKKDSWEVRFRVLFIK